MITHDRRPCGCLKTIECPHLKLDPIDEAAGLVKRSEPAVEVETIPEYLRLNVESFEVKDTNPKAAIGATKTPLECTSAITRAYQSISSYLGKVKYGAWNWRAKGARASTYYAAACRHLDQWYEGEHYDADGTPHLANAMSCIMILIEANHLGKLEDDRPPAMDLKPVYAEVEQMMKVIKEKYGDRTPKHYTIKDKL
jgi:hypothetical protein